MTTATQLIVLGLFFFSGACTLTYEIVWARMLVPVFGTGVYAVSTVLTAFMAGLALGAFYFGRVADRYRNSLRLYAILELGIALFALVFPYILAYLDEVYTLIYRFVGDDRYLFSLVRFLLCFVVLLIPTTMMGATLPALTRSAVRGINQVGWRVGGLYAVNTLGAAAGCFAAAFLLLEHLGVTATTYAAAGANLLIAAVAWWLSRTPEGAAEATAPTPAAESAADIGDEDRPAVPTTLVLAAFALSGFAALGYEVVWARVIAMITRSATAQSLSTILVAFLLGIAGGGAVGARLAGRIRNPLSSFAIIELLLALFGLLSISAFGAIPYLLPTIYSSVTWGEHVFKLFAVAFGVMLLPTFLMGLLFPLVGRMHVTRMGSLGRRIGDVYGFNTLGAIFGAFAGGFVLIPALGTQASIVALAALNLVLGLVLLTADRTLSSVRRLVTFGVAGVPILVVALLLPADFLASLFAWSEPGSRMPYLHETAEGTVTVHEYRDGKRLLKVNGGGEVPTDYASLQTFRLLGNLPMLLHDQPDEVLVIAFGGGISLASAARHEPQRLDCAEVVPGVIGAAGFFADHNDRIYNRLDRPGIELIAEDGRNHVLRTDRRYDVIIGDATHPGTADSWVLYTEEFYRLCRSRLEEGGILCQWLPLHGLSAADFRMILRTFNAVFPHASIWLTREYTILMGTPGPLRIDVERLRARLAKPAIAEPLALVDLGDPVSFLSSLALAEEALTAFAGAGEGATNTDDHPFISFTDRTRARTGRGIVALETIQPHLAGQAEAVLTRADPGLRQRLSRRMQARNETVAGVIALERKDGPGAAAAFARALETAPDEPWARHTLREWKAASR